MTTINMNLFNEHELKDAKMILITIPEDDWLQHDMEEYAAMRKTIANFFHLPVLIVEGSLDFTLLTKEEMEMIKEQIDFALQFKDGQ